MAQTDPVYDPEKRPDGEGPSDFRLWLKTGVSPSEREEIDKQALRDAEEEAASDETSGAGEDESKTETATETGTAGGATSAASDGVDDAEGPKKGVKGRLLGGLSKRGTAVALGGGIIGFLALLFLIVGPFSGILELDHLLQNIDVKTFARFNASFSHRSDSYLRSYIRLRLMEREGATDPINGNLFFRSNKVDTNNPFYDWYRTMRTSKFEEEVFNKHDIKFTSMVGPDGKLRTAKITFGGDDSATFDPRTRLSPEEIDKLANGDITVLNKLGADADHFVNVEIYDNPKAARKAVKQVVEDNTKFFQVVKRRTLRKDIQNMNGITSWTFFEKTVGKYQNFKIEIQRKIIAKIFSGNTETQNFIKCLFGAGSCPGTTDPNDPETHVGAVPTGGAVNDPNSDSQSTQDAKGKKTDVSLDPSAASSAANGAIQDAAGDVNSPNSPIKDFISKFVSKELGGDLTGSVNPTRMWSILKKVASVDNFLNDSGGSSKFMTLIKNAKRQQLSAIWTTFEIARDQMHTGQLSPAEFGAFMSTIKNFNNSESWQYLQKGSFDNGSASADSTTPAPTKAQYCAADHVKTFDEFQYFCDDQKANDGGNAATVSQVYSNTIGKVIHPIAVAVNAVTHSIFGAIFNFVSDVASDVVSPVIQGILSATGLDKSLASAVSWVVGALLNFSGAGPMWDGSTPGGPNLIFGGGATVAETATRANGGVKSTPETEKYTNTLAYDYTQSQAANQSLYNRYISLNNTNSLLATTIVNIRTSSFASAVNSLLDSPSKVFGNVFSALSAHSSAAIPADSYAQLAGVDTYDIPQVCQDLDPTDPDFLNKATNAWQMLGITPSYDLLDNSDSFWGAVYAKLGTDSSAEATADTIYNCGLLDQSVRGGLGDMFGYTKDGGYGG